MKSDYECLWSKYLPLKQVVIHHFHSLLHLKSFRLLNVFKRSRYEAVYWRWRNLLIWSVSVMTDAPGAMSCIFQDKEKVYIGILKTNRTIFISHSFRIPTALPVLCVSLFSFVGVIISSFHTQNIFKFCTGHKTRWI